MENIEVQDPGTVAQEMLAGVPTAAPAPAVSAVPGVERSPVAASAESGADVPRDIGGHAFRKGFHRENADGTPYKNARGNFMPRGGRHKGVPNSPPTIAQGEMPWSEAEKTAAAASAPVAEEKKTGTPPPPAAAGVHAENATGTKDAAEVGCRLIYLATGYFVDAPEECQPHPTEHENMRESLASVFRSLGWNPSPRWAFVLMLLGYWARVFAKPKVAENIKKKREQWASDTAKPAEKIAPEATKNTPSTPANATVVTRPNLTALSERSA